MSTVDAPSGPARQLHLGPTTKVNWLYHLLCAIAAGAVGGLLYLAATNDEDSGLLIGVLVGQALIACFWSMATSTPGFPGSAVVALGTAVAVDVILVRSGNLKIGAVGVVLAVALLASFAHQIFRRAPRRNLTISIAQDVFASLVTASFGILILVARIDDAQIVIGATILCVAAALVVSHLIDIVMAVPRISYDVRRGAVGLVLGIAAGAATAAYRLDAAALSDVMAYLIFGAVVSAVALLTSAGVTFIAADRTPDLLGSVIVQATLPFACAAPITLLVSLVISS